MTTPTAVAGRYRLDRRLGAGGMATVFLALDTVLERPVALKLLAEHLAEDEAFVARFRREALAAARLQHPNIVQVYDSGRDEESERHFIVMEFVDGPSCADRLRQVEALEIDESTRIVRDACQGLDYAHRAGVVHRDVKPGNLLLSGESGQVKLADFGIAKAAEQTRITQVGSVLGTAAYLSPEQARGEESGPASDIYSLGVCAYQFLTGRLPHEYASLTELALKQQNEPVEPLQAYRPDLPPELDRAVRLCLERNPSARYASALEMAEAVEAGLSGVATEATQRLAAAAPADDLDATQALPQDTAATRALRSRRTGVETPAPGPAPPPARPAPARAPRAPTAEQRRRRLAFLLAGLAVLLAGAALAFGLGGEERRTVTPPDEPNVPQQVDRLKDLIRQNSGSRAP